MGFELIENLRYSSSIPRRLSPAAYQPSERIVVVWDCVNIINGVGTEMCLYTDELKRADVYNNTVHKQVTAWQGLRNNAAHGDCEKFSLKYTVLRISNLPLA
jgi:hypothetical protein